MRTLFRLLLVTLTLMSAAQAADYRVADLKTEYSVDPLGIDVAQPRLSWRVESDERGQRQTAYQVLVASSAEALAQDRGDLWDSGRVESSVTTFMLIAWPPPSSLSS